MLKWIWLALVVIVIDQITKYIATDALLLQQPKEVFSWFSLHLVYNTGAAFSFLADMGGWQRPILASISAIVSLVIIIWMLRLPTRLRLLPLALTFILGGALGNFYDRLLEGRVVDFISLHYLEFYFPAFNLADTCITIGAIFLFADILFGKSKRVSSLSTG